MKNLLLPLFLFATIHASAEPEHGSMSHSFSSNVGEKRYSTTIYDKSFSAEVPAQLTKIVDGQLRWSVEATISLEDAAGRATQEAKGILGDRLNKSWFLKEAGREVSGSGGRYVHHYVFSFQPNAESWMHKGGEEGSVQIVVLLDGTVLKPVPR